MSSNIIVKNSSDTILYTFGDGFSLVSYGGGKRAAESERAYQHGTVITGDKKLGSRLVTVEGVLHQTEAGVEIASNTAFEAEWDELFEAISQEAIGQDTLHLYGYKASRYIICDCLESWNHEWRASNRSGWIELNFRASDPFWYGTTDDDSTQNVTANGTKTYTNTGKASYYPVITWTASGAQTSLKIRNQSDGNREFTYATTIALNDVIEIDCKAGTVKKNGTSDITNFSGPFFKMPTGANTYEFTIVGTINTSTCQVVATPRWL